MASSQKIGDEIQRDYASRFHAEQYLSSGYFLHFHRNMEIYGVVHGRVSVTVAGETRTLTDGQLAVIDGLENHSYEISDKAEVVYIHIGTRYLNNLYNFYPKRRLPVWLTDVEYNGCLYDQIRQVIGSGDSIPELKRTAIACSLFSDIIRHYGTAPKSANVISEDTVTQVVQYIYEHYREKITLETLSQVFYVSPKALSKIIKKRLNVDLRVFINDIRVQRAVLMRDDPRNNGKSLAQIAAECGFTNMGTFYRCYERNFRLRELKSE